MPLEMPSDVRRVHTLRGMRHLSPREELRITEPKL